VPGARPSEAFAAFIGPIQQAVSCLATCKITTARGGRHPELEAPHQWMINDGAGLRLRPKNGPALQFDALMRWKLIEDDRADYGPLRVTTLGYDYSLSVAETNTELFAVHWHPDGPSPEDQPHLHLGPALLAEDAPVTPKAHLRTHRMTFESVVRWAFEFGIAPACADWDEKLILAESPHLLYRSWHQRALSGSPE
jgi:hypothetical protein